MAPMDCTSCLSKIGRKVVPPSLDFHTPPDAAPTSNVVLPSASGRAAMAAMRPLIAAEPMLRAPRPEIMALLKTGAGAGAADTALNMVPASSAARERVLLARLIAWLPRSWW